jgi:hypothetical protein
MTYIILQLLHPLSAPPLLLWALASQPGSAARRGGLGGTATHHWDPWRASQPRPSRA